MTTLFIQTLYVFRAQLTTLALRVVGVIIIKDMICGPLNYVEEDGHQKF